MRPAVACATCGQLITAADPPPNTDLEPLLSGHCRFCHQAADFVSYHDARGYEGLRFQRGQLVLLSTWLRLKAKGDGRMRCCVSAGGTCETAGGS